MGIFVVIQLGNVIQHVEQKSRVGVLSCMVRYRYRFFGASGIRHGGETATQEIWENSTVGSRCYRRSSTNLAWGQTLIRRKYDPYPNPSRTRIENRKSLPHDEQVALQRTVFIGNIDRVALWGSFFLLLSWRLKLWILKLLQKRGQVSVSANDARLHDQRNR
jgi:hypothetical protein